MWSIIHIGARFSPYPHLNFFFLLCFECLCSSFLPCQLVVILLTTNSMSLTHDRKTRKLQTLIIWKIHLISCLFIIYISNFHRYWKSRNICCLIISWLSDSFFGDNVISSFLRNNNPAILLLWHSAFSFGVVEMFTGLFDWSCNNCCLF